MPQKSTIIAKKQLIDRISNSLSKKRTSLNKNQVEAVLNELLSETKKSLIKGEEVKLQGYFTFKTTMTTPRMAMNLQTKKKMKVPAKRVPKCKFSVSLKEEIAKIAKK